MIDRKTAKPIPANNGATSLPSKSTDEKHWAGFESAVRSMLPADEAAELLAHSRAHYFSDRAKKWRNALRESERSKRQGIGVRMRGLHNV